MSLRARGVGDVLELRIKACPVVHGKVVGRRAAEALEKLLVQFRADTDTDDADDERNRPAAWRAQA